MHSNSRGKRGQETIITTLYQVCVCVCVLNEFHASLLRGVKVIRPLTVH